MNVILLNFNSIDRFFHFDEIIPKKYRKLLRDRDRRIQCGVVIKCILAFKILNNEIDKTLNTQQK